LPEVSGARCTDAYLQLMHEAAGLCSAEGDLRMRLEHVIRLLLAAGICDTAAFHLPAIDDAFLYAHQGLHENAGRGEPTDCRHRAPSAACGIGRPLHHLALLLDAHKEDAAAPPECRYTSRGTWWQPGSSEGAGSLKTGYVGRLATWFPAWALIPLSFQGQSLGLLFVAGSRKGLLSGEEVVCLECVAGIVAPVLGAEIARKGLERAEDEIRLQRKLMPICAHCKKIRDDEGYWDEFEAYMSRYFDASFSHGICPSCLSEHYPQLRLRPS